MENRKLPHDPVVSLLIRAGKVIFPGHDRVDQRIPGFTHGCPEHLCHIGGANFRLENKAAPGILIPRVRISCFLLTGCFLRLISQIGIDLSGRKVLILGGTGGAGSMARILSEDLGAREIVIASRGTYSQNKLPDTPTEDRISSNISFVAYDDLPQDAEIIINATPVGTYPNITDSPADLSDFDNCVGVCDLIYNPLRTELLIQAKELGIRYTNGLPMLVRQAAAAALLG